MKESFVVNGLAGERTLKGDIPVRGAKNDALKILAASFLFKDTVEITNVPAIDDIGALSNLIQDLGSTVLRTDRGVAVTAPNDTSAKLDRTMAKKLRASVVLMGPILARYGKVSFPHPGGCVIGARPIDLFLRSFEKMGASYSVDDEYYHIEASSGKLHGADIFLDVASVGVTETVMMAATLADGTTYIRNAAMEPEIQNLANYLVKCGASIEGIGTPTLVIRGGDVLESKGEEYHVIPDRIETGSFLILAALAADEVRVTGCEPQHVRSLLSLLEQAGVNFTIESDAITVRKPSAPYKAVNIKTHEYPGFATDLQAPMTVFLTQTDGESLVFETMFEGRLNYTQDLIKMGADITMFDPHRVMVRGPHPLTGRELEGPDLRAGLAYVIAGIIARKKSTISSIGHIDRGYDRIEERLREIGVDIERISE
ncbi:MAG: UDP-N-acetylglucosamine 1-carboxyvinyltransferase [Candidatus Paceibacterota bacterium]|jgi:UDP-N-acetylglucosamine 1-carboxyvinyltransferase